MVRQALDDMFKSTRYLMRMYGIQVLDQHLAFPLQDSKWQVLAFDLRDQEHLVQSKGTLIDESTVQNAARLGHEFLIVQNLILNGGDEVDSIWLIRSLFPDRKL